MANLYLLINELEREEQRGLRRERVIRDRTNPLEFPDHIFRENYRLPKNLVLEICDELRPDLTFETQRGMPLSVEMQVLVCLGFLATGSIQRTMGLNIHHQVHQSSVSRSISRVLEAFTVRLHRYIAFPTSQQELDNIQLGFTEIGGFPSCIGAIDCTQIPIRRPSTPDWHCFINSQGFCSINIQIVCDADTRILNIVARWPGSSTNTEIWENCSLRELFTSGRIPLGNSLVGDSAYPLEPYLMTPVVEPENYREEHYNIFHGSMMKPMKRCIARYKTTWQAMNMVGGTLLYSPAKVCKMAAAAAVLHNICVENQIPEPEPEPEVNNHLEANDGSHDIESSDDEFDITDVIMRTQGNIIRNQCIQNLFQTQ